MEETRTVIIGVVQGTGDMKNRGKEKERGERTQYEGQENC